MSTNFCFVSFGDVDTQMKSFFVKTDQKHTQYVRWDKQLGDNSKLDWAQTLWGVALCEYPFLSTKACTWAKASTCDWVTVIYLYGRLAQFSEKKSKYAQKDE